MIQSLKNRRALKDFRQLIGVVEAAENIWGKNTPSYWLPEEIQITGDSATSRRVIQWRETPNGQETLHGRPAPPPEGCLKDFLKLGQLEYHRPFFDTQDPFQLDAPGLAQVEAFLHKRGVLGLGPAPMSESLGTGATYREPISFYIDLARLFQTLLQVAIDLRDQTITFPLGEDVIELLKHRPPRQAPEPRPVPANPQELQAAVEQLIAYWMRCASIRAATILDPLDRTWKHSFSLLPWRKTAAWDAKHYAAEGQGAWPYQQYPPFLDLPLLNGRPSPLFTILVAQATALLTASPGLRQCPFCGGFYQPRRKPRTDRRETCGQARCKTAAHNEMQNARNHKLREARAKETPPGHSASEAAVSEAAVSESSLSQRSF